jgi:hypothetical protein
MIKYSLKCSDNHDYEAWFASSSAYDALASAGQLQCPVCGTANVSKALMAPNIPARRNNRTEPVAAASPAAAPVDEAQREAVKMMRKLREFVEKNSDYVGPRFADEARKIHNEEVEARSIHGEASRDELIELSDDGIEFFPMPVLPEDHN